MLLIYCVVGLNNKEDDMSRPKPGTLISKQARDIFLYDPDIIFQPKEYVGYVMRNNDQDMIYASKCTHVSMSHLIWRKCRASLSNSLV